MIDIKDLILVEVHGGNPRVGLAMHRESEIYYWVFLDDADNIIGVKSLV